MSSNSKHFLAEAEENMMAIWQKEDTFKKSLDNRKGAERFSFYDGPPYANGLPHYGHAVQSILKDSVTRYKTMRGYYVPRRTGWDTHGLPIEYKIEQEQGFKSKQDIINFGIENFNRLCRESVFTYVEQWNGFFDRIGRWRDTESQYATLENSYIESVWWAFGQIYDKDLVYEDFRSTPYCPRCATPLSNFEVNQGYQDDVEDPSLYVKFKIKGDDRKLLAWTTTPWSLPGNAAIAVNPGELYVTVKMKNDDGEEERLVLAEKRLSILDGKYEVEAECSGQELVGLEYLPLFELDGKAYDVANPNMYKVWPADFVSIEDGSGVLHVAPAFGEDDLALGKEQSIPVLSIVDTNGKVKDDIGFSDVAGKFFKGADKIIIEHLTKTGDVFAAETIKHTYPFCWRCDSPLLYYATTSWFIKVSSVRGDLVANNQKINWVPGHIREGRFGKWLEGARDWAFSRNRFWGAPLPIWRTEDGEIVVVRSIEELKSMAKNPDEIDDLHRPFIDDVVIVTPSGKEARRVEEVFDVWFEAGSMPYGQDHYPFENKQLTEEGFPADFIAEAQDQTRGWFYSLHVIASIIFGEPAFKNCVVTGWVNAADGEKLSKRKKNYTPLDEFFDIYGADAIRYFMMTSPIVHGEDINFNTAYLTDIQRNVLMTLQNSHNFFKMYRDIDGWQAPDVLVEPESTHPLDTWMIERLQQTINESTDYFDKYQIDRASKPIRELLDDLSNWYVRRSRRRFWKSDDDADKQQAYVTLHYCLVRICQLMAPWTPFIADRIYRELVVGTSMAESVHLTDWPESRKVNQQVLDEMATIRQLITDGLSIRAEAGIKVRQPLARATVLANYDFSDELLTMAEEELNVKEIEFAKAKEGKISLDTILTDELKQEGTARDVVRLVQSFRKKAGLNVEDRIKLSLATDDEHLAQSIQQHIENIKNETLATDFDDNSSYEHTEKVKIATKELTISLQRVS
jgi:isoleucyl-tRNA synthetase